ncbi:hypothetical protein SFC43_13280 [Bacteroides sp. CR5/BHMF/2]|nr:hypothetical protein [Bacteroides sp. CR5/BHMF/2]
MRNWASSLTLPGKCLYKNIDHNYKYNPKHLDRSLYTLHNGKVVYNPGMDKITARQAAQTPHFASYQNTEVVRSIRVGAESYLDALQSQPGAMRRLRRVDSALPCWGKKGSTSRMGNGYRRKPGKMRPQKRSAT